MYPPEIKDFEAFDRLKKFLSTGDYKYVKDQLKSEIKVGRNDPCPCGSGLKFKKCCSK